MCSDKASWRRVPSGGDLKTRTTNETDTKPRPTQYMQINCTNFCLFVCLEPLCQRGVNGFGLDSLCSCSELFRHSLWLGQNGLPPVYNQCQCQCQCQQQCQCTCQCHSSSTAAKPADIDIDTDYILVVGHFGLATGSGGNTQSNMHNESCPKSFTPR